MSKNDLFGGLGGLMKGLSGFMPQDDPDVKLMNAQLEITELEKQETEIYAQIGRQALKQGKGLFPELESKLHLVQTNLLEAQDKLKNAQAEKDMKQAAQLANTCPACGIVNAEGTKFCQECGGKLGALNCRNCGASLKPGSRFCGECGAKQVSE